MSDGSVKRQGAGPYDLLSPRSQRGPRPYPGASCVPALASLISQGHPSWSHEEGSFADFRGLDSSPSPLWRNIHSALSSLPLTASLQRDLLLPGCSRRPRGPEVMGSTSTLPDGPPDGVMHPTPLPQGPREASKAMLAGWLDFLRSVFILRGISPWVLMCLAYYPQISTNRRGAASWEEKWVFWRETKS